MIHAECDGSLAFDKMLRGNRLLTCLAVSCAERSR
jgi:hypothetical protein